MSMADPRDHSFPLHCKNRQYNSEYAVVLPFQPLNKGCEQCITSYYRPFALSSTRRKIKYAIPTRHRQSKKKILHTISYSNAAIDKIVEDFLVDTIAKKEENKNSRQKLWTSWQKKGTINYI
jgi:hypothetical protein